MTGPLRAEARVREAAVRHVIVRACARCGGKRQAGEPCAGCGNPEPPAVHDLGVQAFTHHDPLKRAWWALIGRHLAAARVRRAARYVKGREGR